MTAATIRSFATHLETREHGAHTVELWRDDDTHREARWRTHYLIIDGQARGYKSEDAAVAAWNANVEMWDEFEVAA